MKKLNKMAIMFASAAVVANSPEDVAAQIKLVGGELTPKLAPNAKAYKYPDESPWAIFEGNYEGQIDWSSLMKNQKKTATSDEDAASLKRPLTPMHSRKTTIQRAAPGILRRHKP